jgi:hypothetical protein
VSFVSTGSCSIAASHDGNENFFATSEVLQSFTIHNPEAVPVTTPETPAAPSTPSTPSDVIVAPNPTTNADRATPNTPNSTELLQQVAPKTPAKGKRTKSIKFTMKSPSGLPLRITASSSCRALPIFKNVQTKKKVNGKVRTVKTKVQTGWTITFTKKGNCRVTFSNSGDNRFLPLRATSIIKIT